MTVHINTIISDLSNKEFIVKNLTGRQTEPSFVMSTTDNANRFHGHVSKTRGGWVWFIQKYDTTDNKVKEVYTERIFLDDEPDAFMQLCKWWHEVNYKVHSSFMNNSFVPMAGKSESEMVEDTISFNCKWTQRPRTDCHVLLDVFKNDTEDDFDEIFDE